MNIQLKNEYVILKALEDEDTKTESGLYIPKETRAEEQVATGEILLDSGEYKKGDKILFHKIIPIDAHLEVNGKSEQVWFIKIKDIIAVI